MPVRICAAPSRCVLCIQGPSNGVYSSTNELQDRECPCGCNRRTSELRCQASQADRMYAPRKPTLARGPCEVSEPREKRDLDLSRLKLLKQPVLDDSNQDLTTIHSGEDASGLRIDCEPGY